MSQPSYFPLHNNKWKKQGFVVDFDCIGDDYSKRKEKDQKKDGEVWGVVMGSIGSNDLEGKENLIEFRREEKKG